MYSQLLTEEKQYVTCFPEILDERISNNLDILLDHKQIIFQI